MKKLVNTIKTETATLPIAAGVLFVAGVIAMIFSLQNWGIYSMLSALVIIGTCALKH